MVADESSGIIPKSVQFIFDFAKQFTVSFIQVYNEKVFDLLNTEQISRQLQVREDKLLGIHVEGLSEYVVKDQAEALNLMQVGEANRSTRATIMNHNSSRSHSIFQIKYERVEGTRLFRSKLNLCDLAGSEKINKQEEIEIGHMAELKNINLSLTTLGKVIQLLAKGSAFVPFRDSNLTRLLQDSFSGGTKTILIATVSPSKSNVEETTSTLKFADRAKNVMQRVKRSEVDVNEDAAVSRLQREIAFLREVLMMKQKGTVNEMSNKVIKLQEENERLK